MNLRLNGRAYLGITISLLLTLACFQMALVLRPGLFTPVTSLDERASFILTQLSLWQLGWLNWMLSALGLLCFGLILSRYLRNSWPAQLGIFLIALGVIPDLIAETCFAFVIPALLQNSEAYGFAAGLEQVAVQLTGTLANGLYNIGGLTLNILLFKQLPAYRRLALLGIPAWFFGFGLSITCAGQWFNAAEFFTAVGMVWSTLWIFAVAIKLFPQPIAEPNE